MSSQRFNSRELFMLTVIVALGIALFYKRATESTLDFSYVELERIVTQIDPDTKPMGGTGSSDWAELNVLIPSVSANEFRKKFEKEVDRVVDKGRWKRSGFGSGGDHFYYYLKKSGHSRRVDFRLVHHKDSNDPLKKAFPDYDRIEIFLVNVQTN